MPDSLLREEPYRTPAGSVDFPFAYVFDASSLTDGQNYEQVQVPLQGDSEFILRHIAGVPLCVAGAAAGGAFNYQNASRSYAQSAKMVWPKNFPVVPEKRYPMNASIYVDLYDVLRDATANAGSTIYNSQIAFFGVKRYSTERGGGGIIQQVTPYRYKERRFSYEYSLTITLGHYTLAGGTITTPATRNVIPLDNYDFELLQVAISDATGTGALITNDFQILLHDPNMRQLSNAALNQGFVNSARQTARLGAPYQGVMPVPSIVFPAGGAIVFDTTSMLANASVPKTYNLSFEGVWRIPC